MHSHKPLPPQLLRPRVKDKNPPDRVNSNRVKEAEERIELIMRGSGVGIWDWDLAEDRLFLSPQFEQLLGWTRDKFPDSSAKLLDLMHPLDIHRVNNAIKNVVSEGKDAFEV